MGTIKTFQRALDSIGFPILYHTTQFYSVRQKRPVTQYHIKKVTIDPETQKSSSEEIFSSYYQLYVIFFLRDLWYYLNGKPIDTSNAQWEEYKQKHEISIEDVMQS